MVNAIIINIFYLKEAKRFHCIWVVVVDSQWKTTASLTTPTIYSKLDP